MKEGDSAPAGLFRREFLDTGLVTFAECSRHYATFGPSELMAEMRTLFSPAFLAIPFGVAGTRYFALMTALIHCAGTHPALSDRERSKLVNICIDVCTYLQSKTDSKRQDAFSRALSAALDDVALAGLYTHVAALVAQRIRDYGGPFEHNVPAPLPASRARREPTRPGAALQVA